MVCALSSPILDISTLGTMFPRSYKKLPEDLILEKNRRKLIWRMYMCIPDFYLEVLVGNFGSRKYSSTTVLNRKSFSGRGVMSSALDLETTTFTTKGIACIKKVTV